MKTLKYVQIQTDDGKSVNDSVTKEVLDSIALSRIAINNSRYNTLDEIEKGLKIKTLLNNAKVGDEITLEDEEWNFLKKLVLAYEPFKNGIFWSPFLLLFK